MTAKKYRFAIIVSQFNSDITFALLAGARDRLLRQGVCPTCIEEVHVPGAIEIPLVAKLLAESKKFDAIICLGAVIRGDTDHYQFVCQQVSLGCQQVMLTHSLPIIFGILTTQNWQQAKDRVGGCAGHKGIEAADSALQMANLMGRLNLNDHAPLSDIA